MFGPSTVDEPLFDGPVSVATASFVNEDGEILLVSAVADDPLAALESVQVCIDVVRRVDAYEEAPAGEVVDVLVQPGPFDGVSGEVLPETELGLFSTLTDDHLFTFMPFAAYQDCGSDLGEQADAFLGYLKEHGDMSLGDAMDQLRSDLQAGPVGDVVCIPDLFPDPLTHRASREVPPTLLPSPSTPSSRPGSRMGGAPVNSASGNLVLTDGGAVSSALYDVTSNPNTVKDNVSPFSHSDSPSRCYLIRVRGLGNESAYTLYGANWKRSF